MSPIGVTIGFTYEDAISRENFRVALEEGISTKVRRPMQRMAMRRALRDPDKFEEVYRAVAPKIFEGVKASGLGFDLDSILDWVAENWVTILKTILMILPFLI